ncbi:Rrf2 family transcriptional regulator [Arsenicitalea aurantiaca]|uniref:Rrf2 family transcriptional regulator n=1 Tax=Arsenicitalea aurantiaca TaxID=1783274 RepID=A0A433XKA6_9HYPH|nr:Rrf2 family transcriptional regulator [Arsenicitalea aurantiaca]RUT34493.1 Rrf2 family transcriptional regulator [Arsenicitalea aurantiaca]
MKRDSRLSAVLHALLHMAHHKGPMTSEALAQCMSTNPVVVRRTLAGLREMGIVRSEKGHAGGWVLARPLEAITLAEIHEALGEPGLLAMAHSSDNPQCLVEQAVNAALGDAFAEAEALLRERFGTVTLAALADDFSRRFAAHGHAGAHNGS